MNKLIEIFKNKAEQTYTFGNGTFNELNAQSNIKYPLIWMLFPLSVTNNSTNNIIVSQTYSFNLQFITSGSLTDKQSKMNSHFDQLNKIMVGYIFQIITITSVLINIYRHFHTPHPLHFPSRVSN